MRYGKLRRTFPNVRTLDSLSSQNGALGRQSKKPKCSVLSAFFIRPRTKPPRIKGRSGKPAPMTCTLLDLVRAVHAVADSEEEVVATVVHLVNSGQVQLCGTFAGAKIRIPPPGRPLPNRSVMRIWACSPLRIDSVGIPFAVARERAGT